MRTKRKSWLVATVATLGMMATSAIAGDVVVVKGKKIHTVSGRIIENGAIVCVDGKIAAIGDAASVAIPEGARVHEAEVVLPGLIDVRTCVGLSGLLNASQDSDQLEASAPVQPELRAIDAYNGKDELVEYLRGYGVTTVHTGHAPGELISGQTLIAKTHGNTIEASLMVEGRAICCTLAETAKKSGKQSPGTRGKQVAMLRQLLIEAGEYRAKLAKKPEGTESKTEPTRNLKLEAMASVLEGKKALLITADRAQDIANALRLAEEFQIAIWLDSAAEAHELIPQIQKAQVPILLHPTMARASGERENLTMRSAAILKENKIPFAIQGGYESYVPKVRVILFEAAIASAHGLPRESAIEAITLSPAKILGIADRVGSIEVGKDADLALYDGDPLEYTTHCVGVILDGKSYPGE
ncbi:MAG: amidohydrolase family protein [Planctomycetota bacterium]